MAYGDRTNQMFISFVTNSNQTTPQCQYGLDPSSLGFHANATTTTYTALNMCEGPGNIPGPQTFIDPGYMHTILLNDLRLSTTYYYRVGSNEHGWSSLLTFTNRPSSSDEDVTLIAYGNMGVSMPQSGAKANIARILAQVLSGRIAFVLHLGDISYAIGTGTQWDAFMSQMEPITSRVPYMIAIGNHEYDHVTGGDKDPSGAPGDGGFQPKWGNYGYDSGGECAVPVVHRFHSPSNGNGLFWYSFDVGPMHIVIYSSEHDFRRSSPQYAWFEQELRSVNRSRTPWLIVGSHRPMYTSRDHAELIKIILQLYLEPLMYKYHVDLNLFAHIHAYERTCPMYQQRCVDDGITHVLIGMGGRSLSNDSYSGAEWSLYHDITYGYSQIWANRTHLNFNYYHTDNDTLADHFQLKKY
ncbi:unnamed protein product [Rotaria sp. Silwood2]|nr:unnamed protein product [Rotaria sp. Silwood2]CAF3227090.1 unnamed protein product [Rotaria sp. Silwood2]CAF3877311.1 unnamed protein product [Rotaria sp. Silwood2]CAF4049761.1 unnamed protein product [Rotaria sp. Silwood2]